MNLRFREQFRFGNRRLKEEKTFGQSKDSSNPASFNIYDSLVYRFVEYL